MKDPLQRLPSFLRIDFATITLNSTANFSCPEIVAKAQSSSVSIDPYYLGYSHCTCNANFYGEAPVCRPCPTGTICNGTGVLAVKAGYWLPEADVERAKASKALEADPIPCYPDGPGTTACNPESSANFTCKVGTAGRLCSVCDNVNGTQYFKEGRSCYSCMVWGWLDLRVLLPLGYSIMIIGMTAYMLWLPPRTPPSAYFRVGASFMQVSISQFPGLVSLRLMFSFRSSAISARVISCGLLQLVVSLKLNNLQVFRSQPLNVQSRTMIIFSAFISLCPYQCLQYCMHQSCSSAVALLASIDTAG